MATVALYPFRLYDPIRRRWYRARYVARFEQIAEQGRPFQIIGAPELREVGEGMAGASASHVQSSPAPSETLPNDFGDGIGIERSARVEESSEVGGDSQASGDDPAWGVRRSV